MESVGTPTRRDSVGSELISGQRVRTRTRRYRVSVLTVLAT